MLEIEKTNAKTETKHNEIFNEVVEKKAHYIAWAIPGLTYSAEFCRQGINADADMYKSLFMKINESKETGTLYPRANMTFLPVNAANYYMGTSCTPR